MDGHKKEAAPTDQPSKRLTRATLHNKTQQEVYPSPAPASDECTLDGSLLTVGRYAVYLVVDRGQLVASVPEVVSVPLSWNAQRTADELQARCASLIERAIAAGACWEVDVRHGFATVHISIPTEILPIMAPSRLTTALANIEAGRATPIGGLQHA